MAVRTGAGTGVVVSLVVFVLTTIFLLVLAIVFYAGKTEAEQERAAAVASLSEYVTSTQRSSDQYKTYLSAAGNQSVSSYLVTRYDDLMRYVSGDPNQSLESVRNDLAALGVSEGMSIRDAIRQLHAQVRTSQTEIQGLTTKLEARDETIAQNQQQMEQLRTAQEQQLAQATQEIARYREAAEEYRTDLYDAVSEVNQTVQRLEDSHAQQVADLRTELNNANIDLNVLRQRVNTYESILADQRAKVKDPSTLVDGSVIRVEPASDLVYINRGRNDRIILGMTFEVYEDQTQIRPDQVTGAMPRGKASIQITKVGDTSSTGKITRAIPGRPVLQNDVIANAVYDPNYRFKFLVHGKFDMDGDGQPTEAEADFLRSLVLDWGGVVVSGNSIPGDLDFLVLGEEPPAPAPPPLNATSQQVENWAARNELRRTYFDLKRQAADAQIPWLNANRFFILIGRTNR